MAPYVKFPKNEIQGVNLLQRNLKPLQKRCRRHIGVIKALDQAYMLRIAKVACW